MDQVSSTIDSFLKSGDNDDVKVVNLTVNSIVKIYKNLFSFFPEKNCFRRRMVASPFFVEFVDLFFCQKMFIFFPWFVPLQESKVFLQINNFASNGLVRRPARGHPAASECSWWPQERRPTCWCYPCSWCSAQASSTSSRTRPLPVWPSSCPSCTSWAASWPLSETATGLTMTTTTTSTSWGSR